MELEEFGPLSAITANAFLNDEQVAGVGRFFRARCASGSKRKRAMCHKTDSMLLEHRLNAKQAAGRLRAEQG